MKRNLATIALLFALALAGCGNKKTINGVTYDTYGLATKGEIKDPNIQYQLITGNVIWAVILSESIVFPGYVVLFDLYEPVGPKPQVKAEGK